MFYMDFPKLDDTNFPNLQNIDVWKYKNNFDYSRWEENVTIRLVGVLWNADYSDVVKFENDEARDAYFDGLEGKSITLNTMMRIKSNGTIRVPIPYDVVSRFNYLYVISPTATSINNPIQYENNSFRLTRRYYFILDSIMLAPNTTELTLQPDIWTTWINDCDIPYMYLWRGHAPVAATNTDTYLANPIDNCEYLLTDDISIDAPRKVTHSEMHPINAGTPYFCFASTIAPLYVAAMGAFTGDDTWTDPVYYDRDIRWGYQQGVDGYNWGYEGISGNINSQFTNINNNTPSVTVYGIPVSDCITIMQHIEYAFPFFFKSIQASFILGADIISIGEAISFSDGTTVNVITGSNSTFNIRFTKDMFDIPEKYQRFAKLYTSQYVDVELSDNQNNTAHIKIENTNGSVAAKVFANIAYPLLNATMLFEGINGTGYANYTWQDASQSITYGDITNYMFKFGIPTYTIWQDGINAWYADNAAGNRARRSSAIAQYQNSVGATNEMKLNNDATQTTNANNTFRTTQAEVDNIAASMAKHVTNIANDGVAMQTNQATANQASLDVMTRTNAAATQVTTYNINKIEADVQTDATSSIDVSKEENNMASVTATNNVATTLAIGGTNALASAAGGVASLVPNWMVGGGNLGAAVSGIANGAASIVTAGMEAANIQANTNVAISTNEHITSRMAQAAIAKAAHATDNAGSSVVEESDKAYDNVMTGNTSNTAQTNVNVAKNNTNAANDQTTNNANAVRSKTAADSNAADTRDTSISNAGYDQSEQIEAAKRTLEAERAFAYNQYRQAKANVPVEIGKENGIDNGHDGASYHYMKMQGLQLRVKTPPIGQLKQVGDYFARFGYNLDQIWDVSNLQVMNHFTYWRARDIWVNEGEGTNGIAQLVIASIFRNGVTVWSNPDEIGRVSIYAN